MPKMPRRESEKARPSSRQSKDKRGIPMQKGVSLPATRPDPDPEWHPIALMVYESLQESGQSSWYESSDWALAYAFCEELSVHKKSNRRSGQMLAVIVSVLDNLLVSEGARRRLHVELHDPEENEEDASVTAIKDYKNRLTASS